MRKAHIKIYDKQAGILTEHNSKHYVFQYDVGYTGLSISLTMPVTEQSYEFETFPPFFDGLLPEGIQLEGLLKRHKIDKTDYFSQLLVTGNDFVGAVTVEEFNSENE